MRENIDQKIKNKKNKFLLSNGNLGVLVTITLSFTLVFAINQSYAWHENLRIDAKKAAEFYQTQPNDPAIIQWKNALQYALNHMGNCFDIQTAISCEYMMSTIISNCNSHPNELLACNDTRVAQYPLILKQAKEAQNDDVEIQKMKKDEAEKIQKMKIEALLKNATRDDTSKVKENAATVTIDRCTNNTTSISVASCDAQLRSLQSDCIVNSSSHNYCKDGRFLSYLNKHGFLNSTASPY